MRDADTIVIGGGHSGLTAAARLAQAGQRVLLFECRPDVGGRAATLSFGDGFRVPGLLHDTQHLFDGAVRQLRLDRAGLHRDEAPAAWLNPQTTGPGLLLHHEAGQAHAEIAAHSARDADRYADYRQHFDRLRPEVAPLLRRVPPDPSAGVLELLRAGWGARGLLLRRDLLDILRTLPMCVADWLNEWFEGDLLKAGLALPAVAGEFTGPWSPGTNALLVVQNCTVAGAVRGGPAGLIKALLATCREYGVTIRTGTEVTAVVVEGGAARGVQLADGSRCNAERVVAAISPKDLLTRLVPAGAFRPQVVERARQIRTRGTTAKLHLGVRGEVRFAHRDAAVSRARIAPSIDAIERAFDPVKYRRFADRPVLDVWIPTVEEPGLAPAGHSVVSVLVHYASADLAGGWTAAQRQGLATVVRDTLGRYIPDLASRIVSEQLLTPADLAAEFRLPGGHLGHGELGLDQMLVRPTLDCARYATPLAGLTLASSGCFPGGGLTCASGLLAAERVLETA